MEKLMEVLAPIIGFVKKHILIPEDLTKKQYEAVGKRRTITGVVCIVYFLAVLFFLSGMVKGIPVLSDLVAWTGTLALPAAGLFLFVGLCAPANLDRRQSEIDGAMRRKNEIALEVVRIKKQIKDTECNGCGSRLQANRASKQLLEKKMEFSAYGYDGRYPGEEKVRYRIACTCGNCGAAQAFDMVMVAAKLTRNQYGAIISRHDFDLNKEIVAYFNWDAKELTNTLSLRNEEVKQLDKLIEDNTEEIKRIDQTVK